MTQDIKKFIGYLTSQLIGEEGKLREAEHNALLARNLDQAVESATKAETVNEVIGVVCAVAKRFEESDDAQDSEGLATVFGRHTSA